MQLINDNSAKPAYLIDLNEIVDELVCLLDGAENDIWRLCRREDRSFVRVD